MSSHTFPPVDLSAPQLTFRAIATGMVLGAILSLCNVYAGLKIGWGFNMSVAAALLSYGFWQTVRAANSNVAPWGKLENNINQTAASAGASISSAGLVAPVPALTMLTGHQFGYWELVIWTSSVALVGVVVGLALRRQLLVVEKIPFPMGIATAETLNEMYAKGAEAMVRVKALLGAAALASIVKVVVKLTKFSKPSLSWGFSLKGKSFTLKNLTFAIDPGFLMIGVGILVGFRSTVSMMLGAVVAWGMIGPYAVAEGWAQAGKPDGMWFRPLVVWLLWPGVVLMVVGSLTSFAFSWRSMLAAIKGAITAARSGEVAPNDDHAFPLKSYLRLAAGALVLSVVLQWYLFGIGVGLAVFAVMLTFVLAIVAGRVAGETGITPVGAMGKVTQLTFGAMAPGAVAANLMSANVTGGAASQCADMLHDLKAGLMLGSSPKYQGIAQIAGVVGGALAGCGAYLILVPDPAATLGTKEWAAPAVIQWKAVAELFRDGIDKLPAGAGAAMAWAAVAGFFLAIAEKKLPQKLRVWVPSPAAAGIAFVIPAYYAVMFLIGGLISKLLPKWAPSWADRFLIVCGAGLIVGDSLTGLVLALLSIFGFM